MIYTVTFSPSLDYMMYPDKLVYGQVNRSREEYIYPGGKGINVSIVLGALGLKSKLLGFTAGFTGNALTEMLAACGCETDFIQLPSGNTRINVKIKSGEETDVNGQGPDIPPQNLQQLYSKLEQLAPGDYLVLAGNIPSSLPPNVYEQILQRLSGRGVHFVVDATNDLLREALTHQPFLIKPNTHELGELFGKTLTTRAEIISCAKQARELGAQNVLVSMAGDGAILLTGDGRMLEQKPPTGTLVNSVGAGDSMVAGFLAGWCRTQSYEKAFTLGLAAGSATAFAPWLATKEAIYNLLKQAEGYEDKEDLL